MTSANFKSYNIDEITVDREARQRKVLSGIEELEESIARLGLINPIVINKNGMLIAGERRLTACKNLGWDKIPVQFVEDLDDYTLQCIEFEENVKRKDLTWQEEVEAVARLHDLKKKNEEDWGIADTADLIGYSPDYVETRLAVAKSLNEPVIKEAKTFSQARNIVKRNKERKKAAVFSGIKTVIEDEKKEEVQAEKPPIIHANFSEWQKTYEGRKFNLIHCDFPYGINAPSSDRMSAAIRDHYDDTSDIYWNLIATLASAMENVVADSAHLIFWFSPKYYSATKEILERMGWRILEYPLIWHKSDNSGIAPNPQETPRNTYEMAFFGIRGDRKLTSAGCKANSFAYPGRKTNAIHPSEKPYEMLRHFMSMVCDEYSYVLDPTCGSGNAIKVAKDLSAIDVLGIEQDENFYNLAVANWDKRS